MYLGKADVNTYDKGSEREFLVSNGSGNYGSSTVIGANTRRGHGLLVARTKRAAQHTVLVSKIEETLYAHNKKYQLSTNRYKDLIYPDGYRYLQEYQGTPVPSMLFVIHSIFLKKSIFMPQNMNCAIVKYELLASPETLCMDLRPLFAHRLNNEIQSGDEKAVFSSTRSASDIISVRGRECLSHVSFTAGAPESVSWSEKPLWFENIIYEREGQPDKPALDSLWSPGYGSVSLKQGECVYVVLSEEPISYGIDEIRALEEETINHLNEYVEKSALPREYNVVRDMIHSSYNLVADSSDVPPAIFSGFPSVEERARDTFISLPGLTLATGRQDVARGILAKWFGAAASGDFVMPGSIEYPNTPVFDEIDAGLWFLYAADKYGRAAGYGNHIENADALISLADKYLEGPEKLGVVMDAETKLLKYFNHDTTWHWMSGNAGGEPLADRKGYLVEINALWYNALCVMENITRLAGKTDDADRYAKLSAECRESFVKVFWNEACHYLYDWVDPHTNKKDDAIRPNAILAASLPYPVLGDELGRQVLKTCWNELYTTYGLRTLDPHHDKFKGRAEGRPDQKKKARVRGMAWPWLLGQFISAFLRYNPDSMDIGWSFIRPFTSHLRRGCMGGVAEYFDGVMPYRPNGDVLSAISLGELLRVLHESLKFSGDDI